MSTYKEAIKAYNKGKSARITYLFDDKVVTAFLVRDKVTHELYCKDNALNFSSQTDSEMFNNLKKKKDWVIE